MLLSVVVALVAVAAARGEAYHSRLVVQGSCPEITNKQDFELDPYVGNWYEIERFPFIWELTTDCVLAIYSKRPTDGVIEVRNTGRVGDGTTDIQGVAVVVRPGVLLLDFPGYPPGEYHVLDTDYETFSCVWSCTEAGDESTQDAWILSRNNTMDAGTLRRAHQVFQDNGIQTYHFISSYQGDDCPYPI